ncbi:MAG: glycosyltransferase family 4 protein [Phaeospirillum sp.]|nr:glycosyltransferase family 4 protein [Phaeospirillum sp.]
MRLCLAIPEIGPGGAERVLTTLANAWAERGWTIHLLTLEDGFRPPFYPLHPAIVYRPLALQGDSASVVGAILGNMRRLWRLRRAVAEIEPDVIVSFIDQMNVSMLLAAMGRGAPVIAAERVHSDPRQLGRVWRWLRRLTYPLAARIVAQTEAAALALAPLSRRPVAVISNPVVAAAITAAAPFPRPFVAAAGRLVHQKGFDLLLRAFAATAPPEWRLAIFGEGPERESLERLAVELGVGSRLSLPGLAAPLAPALAAADLFVLSSRWEGFPNVLCEAMALGVPVIATRCPSGPDIIVRDGVDGLLVAAEDVDELSSALARLLADDGLRRKMGQNGRDVLDRFGLAEALAGWDGMFVEAVGRRGLRRGATLL